MLWNKHRQSKRPGFGFPRRSIEEQEIEILEDRLSRLTDPEPPASVRAAWMRALPETDREPAQFRKRAAWLALVPVGALVLLAAVFFVGKPLQKSVLADVIKAARGVKSVHVVGITGKARYELWAEGDKWRRLEDGVLQEVSDGKRAYWYHPFARTIRTRPVERWDGMLYELLPCLDLKYVEKAVEQGRMTVSRKRVTFRGRDHILITAHLRPGHRYRIYADPETKLAARVVGELDEGGYHPVVDFDKIEYNVQIPARMFNPEIPKGWQVDPRSAPRHPDELTKLPAATAPRDELSFALIDVRAGENDTIIVKVGVSGAEKAILRHALYWRGVSVIDSETEGQAVAYVIGGGPSDPVDRDLNLKDGMHVLTLKRLRGHVGEVPPLVDVYFTTKEKVPGLPSDPERRKFYKPPCWKNVGASNVFERVPVGGRDSAAQVAAPVGTARPPIKITM